MEVGANHATINQAMAAFYGDIRSKSGDGSAAKREVTCLHWQTPKSEFLLAGTLAISDHNGGLTGDKTYPASHFENPYAD